MEMKKTKTTQLTFEQAENDLLSEEIAQIKSKSNTSNSKSAFEKLPPSFLSL